MTFKELSRFGHSERSRLVRVVSCVALAGAVFCHEVASANSDAVFWFEQYVQSESDGRAVCTQVLVYDFDRLIGELEIAKLMGEKALIDVVGEGADAIDYLDLSQPLEPLITARFVVEHGASATTLTKPVTLERDGNYLPFDMEVLFERPGAFAGKLELEIQVQRFTFIRKTRFWLQNNDSGTSFISPVEYDRVRRESAALLSPDHSAGLEPGDVPGEGSLPECTTGREPWCR